MNRIALATLIVLACATPASAQAPPFRPSSPAEGWGLAVAPPSLPVAHRGIAIAAASFEDPPRSGDAWLWGMGIGGALGGAGGVLFGFALDNIENGGHVRLGEATWVGGAIGLVGGAALGAGIGWLWDLR